MISTLRAFYGLQPTPPADLFQFFLWEILSEHALPARRDLAWQALRRIPALTPDAMFRAPAKDVLEALGIAGANRDDKLERIRGVVGEFKRHRDVMSGEALLRMGPFRAARALSRLDQVSAVARARAILFVVGRPVLPVDDDVNRVLGRLMGVPGNRSRPVARRWLAARLQSDVSAYRDAIIYLRHHAQQTCIKVAPHCGVCPLRADCPSAVVERLVQ